MITKPRIILLWILIPAYSLLPEVPSPDVRKPNIPYFMESLSFQTVQMYIFNPDVSGMVMDTYSDLQWNPAYILRISQKSIYFDLNTQERVSQPIIQVPYDRMTYYENTLYDNSNDVLPEWYTYTSVRAVHTVPHYNFAGLVPINSKLSAAFINRVLFDYGPFRSSTGWQNKTGFDEGTVNNIGYELKRLEVNHNQQTVFGIQSKLILGYRLSNRLDLGFSIGHYWFKRKGNLYDSRWGTYPHSSFAGLNDETLRVNGHHIEGGIGLLYHLGERTTFGIYGTLRKGRGKEKIAVLDTSNVWSERDTDTNYYNIIKYTLGRHNFYTSNGKSPGFCITFEKSFSSSWVFRSFLYGTWSTIDFSSSVASEDTSFGDHTYDYWLNNTPYFRRREYHAHRESGLNGTGKERTNYWKWFISVIYTPHQQWSLFGGIQIQKYSFKKESREGSTFTSHNRTEYSRYAPETYEGFYTHEKVYSFKRNYKDWIAFLPVGIKAKIFKKLSLIAGVDVALVLIDQNSEGKLLYPVIITKKWENESSVVNDEEINRYEEYSSHPAKQFERFVGHRFGLVYEHANGVKLFVRFYNTILNLNQWAFGFEMNW